MQLSEIPNKDHSNLNAWKDFEVILKIFLHLIGVNIILIEVHIANSMFHQIYFEHQLKTELIVITLLEKKDRWTCKYLLGFIWKLWNYFKAK